MILAFGNIVIDLERRQIRHDGREIVVQPLVFDLLEYMARRPHVVVTKDALVRDVWDGVAVSDGAIAQAMSSLRRVLRSDGRMSTVVQTVWGRGYRFVADVRQVRDGATSSLTDGQRAFDSSILGVARTFVGRTRERAILVEALQNALEGRGGVVTLRGEAGIGKTRLLEEIAAEARSAGARVLWGACWDAPGRPAFWPWAQVLRACANGMGESERVDILASSTAQLARIVPDLDSEGCLAADGASGPGQRSRSALFGAVSAFFERVTARYPLLLAFDDAHAADPASLHLLERIVRDVRGMPLLVVAAYRDDELRQQPSVARVLGYIAHEGVSLSIGPLVGEEVTRFAEDRLGAAATPQFVNALQLATDGSPFLLEEVFPALSASQARQPGGPFRGQPVLTSRAAGLIQRHVERLSSEAREILRVAALLGPTFSLHELSAICELSPDEVREGVEEAASDGIVVVESLAGTRFRFRHALFREALEKELPVAARAALHFAIGEAMERLHRSDPDPWLDSLATHFIKGATHAGASRAVKYAEAAAARAMRQLAYEDADAYLEAALDLLEAANATDAERRCLLLLSLGTCRHKAMGLEPARPVFLRAAELARALGRPDFLARAALGFAPWTPYGLTTDSGVRMLEEALAAQPEIDSPLRAALLARLAHALDGVPGVRSPRERILSLSRDAVDMARRTGDLPTLGRALFAARWVDWNPLSFPSRRTMNDQLLEVSERLGDPELAVLGEGWRVAESLELGDPVALDIAMSRHAALANELKEPEHLWWSAVWRAMRAVMEGRFPEADELVAQALEVGGRVEPENAFLVAFVQFAHLRTSRGELDQALLDLDGVVAERREVFEGDVTVLCRRARLFTELGRRVEARREFDRVAADDFKAVTIDMRYSDNLAALAVTCAALNDRRHAGVIYERLAAANGRNLVFGPGLVASGPADLYQALLAIVMQRYDLAWRHFESAIATSRRMGWLPLVARTQFEHAAALVRMGRKDDRGIASALLREARRVSDALGLESVALSIERLQREIGRAET
jgi:DNA-binding winged helix-turn-helix (wHTH) protein/tetratricopeptide (TPR) repeat protein